MMLMISDFGYCKYDDGDDDDDGYDDDDDDDDDIGDDCIHDNHFDYDSDDWWCFFLSLGFSYSLLTRNLAVLAKDLIQLLSICNQEVEPNLNHLANDYEAGLIIDGHEDDNDNYNDDGNDMD